VTGALPAPFLTTRAGRLSLLLALAKLALLLPVDCGAALARCSKATLLALVDSRWHVDNEERGRPITWCRLRAPLAQMWERSFATGRL
jgi:hypothetical protein